jgi:hypothetical protein
MVEVARSAQLLSGLLKDMPGLNQLVGSDPTALDAITKEITKHLPTPAFVGDTTIVRTVV